MGKSKPKPKWHKVVLTLDPYQSVASMAVSMEVEGYRFHSLIRRGTKATIKYLREDLCEKSE